MKTHYIFLFYYLISLPLLGQNEKFISKSGKDLHFYEDHWKYYEIESYANTKIPDSVNLRVIMRFYESDDSLSTINLIDSLKKVANSTNFGELSKLYSMDYKSSTNNGNLGWIKYDDYIKPLADTCFFSLPNDIKIVISSDLMILVEIQYISDTYSEKIIPIINQNEPYSGEVITNTNINQDSLHGFIENGMKAKEWRTWYENKNLKSESHYAYNFLHGPKTTWYKNGQIESKAFYFIESLRDTLLEFYETGDTCRFCEFYDQTQLKVMSINALTGKINTTENPKESSIYFGKCKEFYKTGSVKAIYEITDKDYLNGEYLYFFENGNTWWSGEYYKGLLKEIYFIKNVIGDNLDIGSFSDGNGILKWYDKNGKLVQEYNMENGRQITK